MAAQGKAFNRQIFKLNAETSYILPTRWDKTKPSIDFTKLQIYVNEKYSFQARNLNIFTDYVLSFFNADVVSKWRSRCDMSFYQNQLNFAVWCASSGCGVSLEHLNAEKKLLSSVFRFHLYYQTRKLLQDMSCPIPGDKIFKTADNNINLLRYQKLCNEFNISVNTDFRFKGGENGGLGTMYNYRTRQGYHALTGLFYDPNKFQFIENSTNEAIKIDYITQEAANEGWKQFILEKSEGFTKAGMVRIDDSIRAYVYCVLGSQAQTRSNIITSLETQQNFVDLLEESIKSLFSIPESIEKYQNAISRTNSRINYVVGIGLYMIPADLVLKVGSLDTYNNNILVAEDSLNVKIGRNETVNTLAQNKMLTQKSEIHILAKDPHETDGPTEIESQDVDPTYLAFGVSCLVFIAFYVFS